MSKTLGQIAYEGFNTFKGNALGWPLASGHAVEEMAAWEAAANAIIEECAKVAEGIAISQRALDKGNYSHEKHAAYMLDQAVSAIRSLKATTSPRPDEEERNDDE